MRTSMCEGDAGACACVRFDSRERSGVVQVQYCEWCVEIGWVGVRAACARVSAACVGASFWRFRIFIAQHRGYNR